jgi:hypothetical protein
VIGVTERLGGTGVWEAAMRFGDPAAAADYAAEVEELGYSAVWIPDVDGDLFGALGSLLASTSSITVASGVLNLWAQDHAGVEIAMPLSVAAICALLAAFAVGGAAHRVGFRAHQCPDERRQHPAQQIRARCRELTGR